MARPARESWGAPFRWRLVAATGVVVLVAAVVLVWGRSDAAPTVGVVVTVEEWPVGTHGAWVTVPVPEGVSGLLVRPGELEGRVAAVRLPDGVIVPSGLLADPADVVAPGPGRTPDPADPPDGNGPARRGMTSWRLDVDVSLWPPPGPAAGDRAVFSAERGGCAVAVLPLRDAAGGSVVVDVDQRLSRLLLATPSLAIWPAPPEGHWPACGDQQEPDREQAPPESADAAVGN